MSRRHTIRCVIASLAALTGTLASTTACTLGPGLKDAPAPTQKGPGADGTHPGEGEGEGATGVVLDCPADSSATSLDDLATRYSAQISPLMTRPSTQGGCLDCHAQDSGRLMTMAADPKDTFYRIRAGGFFRLVTNAIPERV